MARTIYFLDGSHDVILCNEDDLEQNTLILEDILRARLGNDTADLFCQITQKYKEKLDEWMDPESNDW